MSTRQAFNHPNPVLVAALLLSVSAPAFAGKNNQPVPDWAMEAYKTHVPDYAKDAAAIVLYDEYVDTIDAQGRAVERERRVKRVLKPQGRSEITCSVQYSEDEKVNYFRVWTIAANEKQYQAQDYDFTEEGDTGVPVMLSTTRARIAHAPAVDVGATVVCESEVALRPYLHESIWEVQNSIPVVFQALELDLPPGMPYSPAWHSFKPVQPTEVAPNHWRWEVKDTPELNLRGIPSRPDWGALAGRMSVQWGDSAVTGTDAQWRAIGKWITTLEANRPDPSPEITTQTQTLIANSPDFYTKLARITDYIPVDDRRGIVDPADPSLYGNHMITAIEVPDDVKDPRLMAIVKANNGKRYLIFDPTNERVPVGNLPSYEQGSYGTLAAGADSQVLPLPILPPDANSNQRKGSFTLAPDGTLTGSVESVLTGSGGGEMRNLLKYSDEKERREGMELEVAHDVPGVVLDGLLFDQPSALDKPVDIQYKLTAGQYAHQAGTLLHVRPRVVGSDVLPFDDKPRKVPIDLETTGRWHDSFDITLPPGYVVDETPDPVNIDTDFAAYHSTITAKDNHLHYERDYEVRKVEIPADQALAFRHLESQILSDEKGTAVLKKQ